MKKRIHPTLFRNSIYNNFLEYSNPIYNKNTKALILFQDEEIKKHIIKYLNNCKISILNLYISRSSNILNMNISFFKQNNLYSLFFKKIEYISKLNFVKFNVLNKILNKNQKKQINIISNYNKGLKLLKQKFFLMKLSKLRSQIKKLNFIKLNFNNLHYINLRLLKFNFIHLKLKIKFYLKKNKNKNLNINFQKAFYKSKKFTFKRNFFNNNNVYRSFSTINIKNQLQINPFNNFYNKYKYYSIFHIKNNIEIKSTNNIPFSNILNKKIILDAIKFYNIKKKIFL